MPLGPQREQDALRDVGVVHHLQTARGVPVQRPLHELLDVRVALPVDEGQPHHPEVQTAPDPQVLQRLLSRDLGRRVRSAPRDRAQLRRLVLRGRRGRRRRPGWCWRTRIGVHAGVQRRLRPGPRQRRCSPRSRVQASGRHGRSRPGGSPRRCRHDVLESGRVQRQPGRRRPARRRPSRSRSAGVRLRVAHQGADRLALRQQPGTSRLPTEPVAPVTRIGLGKVMACGRLIGVVPSRPRARCCAALR